MPGVEEPPPPVFGSDWPTLFTVCPDQGLGVGPAGSGGTDEEGSGQAKDRAGLVRLGKEGTWPGGRAPRDTTVGREEKWLPEGSWEAQLAVSNSGRQEWFLLACP